jgi:phosphatidylserine/phosphatidylglycerophosphate/cardiolipin synthase-like enzyme
MTQLTRVLATLGLVVASRLVPSAHANCTGSTLTSWGVANQQYSPGRESFFTQSNWIDSNVYTYSDGIFGKIHELVSKADKHVYLQTWSFRPRAKPALILADAIRKLHERRTRQGKTGTVLIWLMINITAFRNEANEREQINRYLTQHRLQLQNIEFHIGFFKANLLGANHAKSVSIDHKVAFVSGANFSAKNNGVGLFDLGFVVEGSIVRNLDYDFIQTWRSTIDEESYPSYYEHRAYRKPSSCHPILFTRSWAFPNFSTTAQTNSMTDALLRSVQNARQTVHILTPNLNVTKFMQALATAAARGVKVRVVLSKDFTDDLQDLPTRGGNNYQTIRRLHKAIRPHMSPRQICESLQIRWFGYDGQRPVEGPKSPASHAKFMIVDGKVVYFGSADMDNQSWVNSREIALFVEKPSLARSWKQRIYDRVWENAVLPSECAYY